MKRLRIVLVEDDAVIGALIAELIREMGHHVCATAGTHAEAVAAALQHAPDVMIVDVVLGDGSGVAAVAEIQRRADIPHIFMTGGTRRSIPLHATVLAKPFGLAGLAAALARAAPPSATAP